MNSTQSETGTSYSSLSPAHLPPVLPMPLPRMPRLEDYPDTAQYENAWRAYRAQMEHLRPGVSDDVLDRELAEALREFGKVNKIVEIDGDDE